MNKKVSGFSLVELAIGLAVIAVLILAVSMSSGIRDNARVQSAANSVQTLRSAVENYLASGKLNYTGMDISALKNLKLLPANFSGSKSSPWGGDYGIAANAADPTRYDVSVGGLAKADADKLTSYFNNSANAVGFDAAKNTWTATF